MSPWLTGCARAPWALPPTKETATYLALLALKITFCLQTPSCVSLYLFLSLTQTHFSLLPRLLSKILHSHSHTHTPTSIYPHPSLRSFFGDQETYLGWVTFTNLVPTPWQNSFLFLGLFLDWGCFYFCSLIRTCGGDYEVSDSGIQYYS